MESILNWLNGFWTALVEWLEGLWKAFKDFLTDWPITVLDAFLQAVAAAINAIPVPAFIQTGLAPLFSGIDPWVLWVVNGAGLFEALAIVGLGYGFRMVRKIFTLFQW